MGRPLFTMAVVLGGLFHFNGADGTGVDALATINTSISDIGLAVFQDNGFNGTGGNTGFASRTLFFVNECWHYVSFH